jgi:hypothetical protein
MSLNCGHQRALCLSPRWYRPMSVECHGGITSTGGTEELRENPAPSDTSSVKYPTWTDPGTNMGLCGESPATNCLNYGTELLRI